MSLKTKSLFTIFLGSLISIILLFFLSYFFILKEFERIEVSEVRTKLKQTQETIKSDLSKLADKSGDWAIWDDTYNFIKDKNPKYIEANLVDETFSQTKWNFIIYLNLKKEVVYKKGYDFVSKKELPIYDKEILNILEQDNHFSEIKEYGDKVIEFIKINNQLAVICLMPVLKSDGSGPLAGYLITGYFYDENIKKELSKKLQNEVLIIPYSQALLEFNEFSSEIILKEDDFLVAKRGLNKLVNYLIIRDDHQPIFALKFYSDRILYQQGVKTILSFLISYLIILGIVILFYYLFLYSFIIKQLENILLSVREISEKKDFSLRIKNLGKDEFGTIGQSFNQMLDVLAQVMEKEKEKALQLEKQNKELEDLKKAMFNILEDEREAKAGVEKKVEEKTKELSLLNEKLTENWLQLQSSIRSLPLGFILINPDHKIIIANQRIREILEIDRNEDLTCERITQIFSGKVDLLSQCQIASSKRQVIKISEVEFKNKILKMKFIPVLNQSNQVTSTIFLVEDITEDKRLQRARDEFFSIASHELRTPLTAIRGNTSMILDYYKEEIKDENLKQMLFDVHEASVRLIDIINDFLNLSRLEMGKIVFKNENFDLKVLVDEVIEELLPVAKNKGLYLQAESEFPSLLVLADKERTREVLVNLVGNALKFTQKGGVKVVLKKEGNYAQVLVEDTGIGISEKNRNLLFQKFQQASDSILTRDVTRGTGLGLYISKLVIENMKGEIGLLKSEVGKGSTFYFKLPLVLTN